MMLKVVFYGTHIIHAVRYETERKKSVALQIEIKILWRGMWIYVNDVKENEHRVLTNVPKSLHRCRFL